MKLSQANLFMRKNKYARLWLPYCFRKMEHDKHKYVFLPLNREYKPIGLPYDPWINYENYARNMVVLTRNPEKLEGIWINKG